MLGNHYVYILVKSPPCQVLIGDKWSHNLAGKVGSSIGSIQPKMGNAYTRLLYPKRKKKKEQEKEVQSVGTSYHNL